LARRLGATPEQIAALARADLSGFEESWAVALRAAETMTSDRGEIPPAAYANLEGHWSAGEIIEIVAVISLFNYFNRFAIALDIPPTK
jgi:alkylhydroperoxidase family enzyme